MATKRKADDLQGAGGDGSGGEDAGVQADDLVPSQGALSVVQGWLGISNASQILASSSAAGLNPHQQSSEDPDKPRPPRLGLGAKFLAHNKAVALTGGLEKRLSKKLFASADNRNGAAAGAHSARRGQHGQPSDRSGDADSDDSDDDMASRSRSFGAKGGGRAGAVASKPRWGSEALRPPPPVAAGGPPGAQPNKKSKKKKKKKAGGGAAEQP